jgi:hypothetical protein
MTHTATETTGACACAGRVGRTVQLTRSDLPPGTSSIGAAILKPVPPHSHTANRSCCQRCCGTQQATTMATTGDSLLSPSPCGRSLCTRERQAAFTQGQGQGQNSIVRPGHYVRYFSHFIIVQHHLKFRTCALRQKPHNHSTIYHAWVDSYPGQCHRGNVGNGYCTTET